MTPPADKFEVLDAQGHKTGQLLDLPAIHQQELWHEVVNVWIVNGKGEILMQLRAPGVELSPNVWDVTVGSHLRLNESPPDGALRSLQAELGIETTPEELQHLFNIQCANPMPNGTLHKVLGHVFLMHRDVDIAALSYDTNKISQLAWVPITRLMTEVGSTSTRSHYFPRANNYYPKLFEEFQAWM